MEQIKIKNALSFYCIANNLKYNKFYNVTTPNGIEIPTYACHIYGSMILAIALNSEFENTKNIGKVIKMIALTYLNTLDEKELKDCLSNMSLAQEYYNEMKELEECKTNEANLALYAINLDRHFSETYLRKENMSSELLYKEALSNRLFTPSSEEDLNKFMEIIKFYYLNQTLKQKERSGWDESHWNIQTTHKERIAEHVFGTIILALSLTSEFSFNINLDEVLETLVVHEIGEILIGDITPFDNITPEQKATIEHEAMSKVLGNLSIKDYLLKKLIAFDNQSTNDAKFALWCDKLEADLQSKNYQERNLHLPLNQNPNNIVLQTPKVKQMIKEGATTAFDIWYEWDKPKFKDSPIFAKTLEYVKNNKIISK